MRLYVESKLIFNQMFLIIVFDLQVLMFSGTLKIKFTKPLMKQVQILKILNDREGLFKTSFIKSKKDLKFFTDVLFKILIIVFIMNTEN